MVLDAVLVTELEIRKMKYLVVRLEILRLVNRNVLSSRTASTFFMVGILHIRSIKNRLGVHVLVPMQNASSWSVGLLVAVGEVATMVFTLMIIKKFKVMLQVDPILKVALKVTFFLEN